MTPTNVEVEDVVRVLEQLGPVGEVDARVASLADPILDDNVSREALRVDLEAPAFARRAQVHEGGGWGVVDDTVEDVWKHGVIDDRGGSGL